MFGRIKTWLLSLRDDTVADQQSEIAGLKAELATLAAKKAKLGDLATRRLENWRRDTERLYAAIDGVGRRFDGNLCEYSPEAIRDAVKDHVASQVQSIELRASKSEKDVEDLRAALADERRQHDQTRGALNASEAENAEVWQRIEKIRAQTAADIAIQARRKAIAETDARRKPEDDEAA